ncbi:hypothetical protein ACLMAL_06050 [Nocardia sp. CWNU-33]|uniref:hypothetical protein n=1 Tax=Nocardia sp. CWNU-33 TaxID=3392117 RepID=UPI00398E8532
MTKLGITPPQKSSLVSVEVGPDRLPTNIKLSRNWKNTFEPAQLGRSIMDAYRFGLYEMTARMVEAGTLPPSTVPSLRDAAPMLLRTRTIEDFRELYDQLYLENPITVHGPGRNAYGQPVLTVTASSAKLISISIDATWANEIDANFVAQDILECCQQIRANRPKPIKDVYMDREPDSQVASRVVEHENYLLQDS